MRPGTADNAGAPCKSTEFTATHWSLVLEAACSGSPDSHAALGQLCQAYWYPLYLFVRRSGHNAEEAQDLIQEFFAKLIEKNYLAAANPEKGRFRTFLLVCLKRFLCDEWDRSQRQKRGAGVSLVSLDEQDTELRYRFEPVDHLTPEKAFDRRWALTLLDQVLRQLQAELAANGKAEVFQELRIFLTGEKSDRGYAEIARDLQMTEGALKVTIHRLRQRYGALLRLKIPIP